MPKAEQTNASSPIPPIPSQTEAKLERTSHRSLQPFSLLRMSAWLVELQLGYPISRFDPPDFLR